MQTFHSKFNPDFEDLLVVMKAIIQRNLKGISRKRFSFLVSAQKRQLLKKINCLIINM
jgi:hypothetical protein